MSLGRRAGWLAMLSASLIVLSAFILLAGAGRTEWRALPVGVEREGAGLPIRPALFPADLPVRMCVTRYGYCPIGPLRAGDPCGCPHTLRGSVPGKVRVLDSAAATDGRPWAEGLEVEPGRRLRLEDAP